MTHRFVFVAVILVALLDKSSLAAVLPPIDGFSGSYRVAFVTSAIGNATSTEISTYNDFVQSVADSSSSEDLRDATFRVLGSTSAVSARENSLTRESDPLAGLPIYNTRGLRVANSSADLWDGSILTAINSDESGVVLPALTRIHTGTGSDGQPGQAPFPGVTAGPLGSYAIVIGGFSTNEWWIYDYRDLASSTASLRFYALSLSAFPIIRVSGDYNENGSVDAADYTVWRDTMGQTGSGLAADGTGPAAVPDNVVDELDYTYWRSHFGEGSGSGAAGSAAVPEPGTHSLLFAGLVLLQAVTLRFRSIRAS